MRDDILSLNEHNVVKRLTQVNINIIQNAKLEIKKDQKSIMSKQQNKEIIKKTLKQQSNEVFIDKNDVLYEKIEQFLMDKIKSNIGLIEN